MTNIAVDHGSLDSNRTVKSHASSSLADYTKERAFLDDESIGLEDVIRQKDRDPTFTQRNFVKTLNSRITPFGLKPQTHDKTEIRFCIKRKVQSARREEATLSDRLHTDRTSVGLTFTENPNPFMSPTMSKPSITFHGHAQFPAGITSEKSADHGKSPTKDSSRKTCITPTESPRRKTHITQDIKVDFSPMKGTLLFTPDTSRGALAELTGLFGIEEVLEEDSVATQQSPQTEHTGSSNPNAPPEKTRRRLSNGLALFLSPLHKHSPQKNNINDSLRSMREDLLEASRRADLERKDPNSPMCTRKNRRSSFDDTSCCQDTPMRRAPTRRRSHDMGIADKAEGTNVQVMSGTPRRLAPTRRRSHDMGKEDMTKGTNMQMFGIRSPHERARSQEKLIKQMYKDIQEAAATEEEPKATNGQRGNAHSGSPIPSRGNGMALLALQSSMRGSRVRISAERMKEIH
jgi:hypothetical protein